MKILFLTHYFPPEVNAPATRTFEHCVRWARAGHEVTVVTCAPNCPNGVVYPGYKNRWRRQIEEIEGVRVVRTWTYVAPNAGTLKRVLNYVSFMLSAVVASIRLPRPDVVLATSPQFFCGWAGVFVSWLKWVPLVLEIRDIWPESIQAVGAISNRRVLGALERLERWMYRSATHIVAVGNGYRDNVLGKVDVSERISVITNGVDLEFYRPQEPDVRFLHIWDLEDKFVCSYVGTIGMAHGLEVVLEAAKILKHKGRGDITFVLVGDGAQRQCLQEEAKRAGLEDLVVFVGRQPKKEIPAILASSNACLIHLRACELFQTVLPSKIFEVMAMGRPMIMGVGGEAREIVMQSDAGIEMEPGSAESLVQAVEIMADDPEATAQRGRLARDYVAEHFDRNVLAATFLTLLEVVAGKEEAEKPLEEPAVTEAADEIMADSEQSP